MTLPLQNSKKEVLFFSPFSGIWKHSLAEFTLMKLISKRYRVKVIRCEQTFSEFCTVMNAKGLAISSTEYEKKSICAGCLKNASLLRNPDFEVLSYQSTFTDLESKSVEEKIENASTEDLIRFEFLKVPVGKISTFETIIKFKKTTLNFSGSEIEHLRAKIKHAVRSVMIAREILAKNSPRCVFVFNPEYAVGGAFSDYCTRLGIKVYSVKFTYNSSENTRSVLIWNWGRYKLSSPALEAWASGDRKVNRKELVRASRHLDNVLKSNSLFVYSTQSTGVSSREFFGISRSRKILLLAMSSYDEVFANFTAGLTKYSPLDGKVFSSQIEWVLSTIDFVKDLGDVALIIRPHPREIANRRDSVTSEHSSQVELALKNLPPNVYVDWPKFGFSIYDHFEETQAVLTGWSSAGLEAMMSGIPCVSYDSRLVDFPGDIHFTGDNRREYFQNIMRSLENQNTAMIRLNVLRWYAFAFSRGTVRLGGVLHDQFIFQRYQFSRRLADILEYRFPQSAKRFEMRLGSNPKDEAKLFKVIDLSLDDLFECEGKND